MEAGPPHHWVLDFPVTLNIVREKARNWDQSNVTWTPKMANQQVVFVVMQKYVGGMRLLNKQTTQMI